MTQVCYSLEDAADKLGVSQTVLVRLSQYFKMPADAYEEAGYLSFKGELTFLERDIHFFKEVRERLLEGENLESIKQHLLPMANRDKPAAAPVETRSPVLNATPISVERAEHDTLDALGTPQKKVFNTRPPKPHSTPPVLKPAQKAVVETFENFLDDFPARTPKVKTPLPLRPAKPPKAALPPVETDSSARASAQKARPTDPLSPVMTGMTPPNRAASAGSAGEQHVAMTQSANYQKMAEKTFARYKNQLNPTRVGDVLKGILTETAPPPTRMASPEPTPSAAFRPLKSRIPAASVSPLVPPDVLFSPDLEAFHSDVHGEAPEEWSNAVFATKTYTWSGLMGAAQRPSPGMSQRLQEAALQLRAQALGRP